MQRAVPDPGVLVSALISPEGPPALLLAAAQAGAVELFVSPMLLEELGRVLEREKFRRYVDLDIARAFVRWVRAEAIFVPDPAVAPPLRSIDPGDDYLIALAYAESAQIVSGDAHLLVLAGRAPVCTPAAILEAIDRPTA